MAVSLNQVDTKRDSDEFVSFLPLAWFGEQIISLVSALSIGFAVNFPEKPETILSDLREIGPHILFSPPRVWEDIASSVQVRIMDTTPFKRFMYNTFMPIGEKVAELKLAGKSIPLLSRIQYALAHICLFRALRDRLGLTRVRSALTGGSALGPDVFKFFHAIGVNLKQVYGLTEVSGISCIHRDGDIQGSTVGLPLPGTEITISAQGEILLKGAGTFQGYYKDAEATATALKDGWLHSGDAGQLDPNGHLVVIDRLQDILRLTDGTRCAPQFVESKLKFSPYIKEAVAIGHGRPHLTALVCIDGRIVGKWAGDNKIAYTTYSDLASKTEVADFIEKELTRVNQELPETARIKRFALLYKDLDADENELTRTGKVRRAVIDHSYHDIIEGLYQGVASMPVDITIALQDGKSTRINTTVHFRNL
jgi:long-chain acyl-CoA synthetase